MTLQGALDDRFEALPATGAIFVQAVAIGAFQHQVSGSLRCCRWHQQRCMRRAEITGEDHAFVLAARRVGQVDFHIGRAEDMPGALQANARDQLVVLDQSEPVLMRQRHEMLLDSLEVALDLRLVAADVELEGVLQHDGQEPGRRLPAEDRPVEARGEQIGNASDVIDVHIGHY